MKVMNMAKNGVSLDLRRIWRSGGGLFVGVKYCFPSTLVDDDLVWRFSSRSIVIGLLFWQLTIYIHTCRRKTEYGSNKRTERVDG